MDSFKDLLTKTVGQIKRANEYLAEQPTKTSFKGSTVQNFAAVQCTRPVRRRRPFFQPSTTDPRSSQMQPQPLMSNVPVFRLLVDPVSGPVLPLESVAVTRRWTSQTSQTPKWLDEGQQSGAVYSNLVLNFLSGKA